MPFQSDDIQCGLACGVGPGGHWHGWYDIQVRAAALRRLGLHPDQPTAAVAGPSPPGWWHAAAERNARQDRGSSIRFGRPWARTACDLIAE